MFKDHGGKALQCKKQALVLAINEASNNLLNISCELFIAENQEREDLAQQIVLSLIMLDSAIEESYSRLYKKTFLEHPSNALFHESLYKLGLTGDQVFAVRNLRGLRNSFCHTVQFVKQMRKICKSNESIVFFQSTILNVVSDLRNIQMEIAAIDEAAA